MSVALPSSPLIKTFNAGGRFMQRVGLSLPRLDEAEMLRLARQRTGHADFGGEDFHAALNRLLYAYEYEADLSPIGRLAARSHIINLLSNRLYMEADIKRHPEIVQSRIRAPLFIVGLPRTGSTLLHMLLAQDPANRIPACWEVMFPAPAQGSCRQRIKRTRYLLGWFEKLAPGFQGVHPLSATLPQECIAITSHTFLSYEFQTTHRIPSYQHWLEEQDLSPAYGFHYRFLQYLQWQRPTLRWVLKAPAHLFGLEALFRIYPDAGVIQTHRNPREVAAALASLTTILRGVFSNHVDVKRVGVEMNERWAGAMERVLRMREEGSVPRDRILDVQYADLVHSPLETVRAIYEYFGLKLNKSVENAMQAFLDSHPRDKHGKHDYSLDRFYLDPHYVSRRYAAYCAHFGY